MMEGVPGQAGAVAGKDLLLEVRARAAIVSVVVFPALVLTVFNFGRDPTAVPTIDLAPTILWVTFTFAAMLALRSEEHTSELQSRSDLVCRLLLEKKKKQLGINKFVSVDYLYVIDCTHVANRRL